jgi:hypothetical protein
MASNVPLWRTAAQPGRNLVHSPAFGRRSRPLELAAPRNHVSIMLLLLDQQCKIDGAQKSPARVHCMNISSLPTDNLYKFLALAGIALYGFAITYPTSKMIELELDGVALKAESSILQIKKDYLNKSVERIEAKTLITEDDISKSREQINETRKALDEYAISDIQLKKLKDILDIKIKWQKRYHSVANYSAILGLILASLGLGLWFVRVQIPTDKRLLRELSTKEPLNKSEAAITP